MLASTVAQVQRHQESGKSSDSLYLRFPSQQQEQTRRPSETLMLATKALSEGNFDFDRRLVLDRNTKHLSFFIGDYHESEYRKESANTLNYLIENANVRRVGLEGVWGPPREGMLEDRYKMFERIFGKEVAAQKREGEKALFEPMMDLIQQNVEHDGVKIQAFGLELEKYFVHTTVVFEQSIRVPDLLNRLNTVLEQDPERFKGKTIKEATEMLLGEGGDEEARNIDAYLQNMVTRIKNDPELSKAIGNDPVLYSREIFESREKLIEFQRDMQSAKQRYIITGRDLMSRDLHNEYRSLEGNTAFSMGWIHVGSVALNVKDSAIVVHPIPRGNEIREKRDPTIRAVLQSMGIVAPAFLGSQDSSK